jgi:hypothetical protein
MKNNLTIQFSPTRLKQIKKIALSGNKAKFKTLKGRLYEGYILVKKTVSKLQYFIIKVDQHILQPLTSIWRLTHFSTLENQYSNKLGLTKKLVLGGLLFSISTLPALGQTVTTTNDENGNGANTGLSLREAILQANATVGDQTILLPEGIYTLTTGTSGDNTGLFGDLDIANNGSLSIICTGTNAAVIDGGGIDRVFHILTATLNLSNITVQGGVAPTGSFPASSGGGLYNNGGTAIIDNSTFSMNSATRAGGLFNRGGIMTINNSLITNNRTVQSAGGIDNRDPGAVMTITSSIISHNTSLNDGAGGFNNSTLNINDSFIINNTSSAFGGGIANNGGNFTITSSTISNNIARGGGGVFNLNSNVTVIASSLTGNTATNNDGGGIYQLNSSGNATTSLTNTTLSGNEATIGNGGGITSNTSAHTTTLNLTHVTITSGTAGGGTGGVYLTQSGGTANFNPVNSIIASNNGNDFDTNGTININTGGQVNLVQTDASGSNISAFGAGTDPLFGVLTLNSGFFVHELQTGSPAIDIATITLTTADQVGNPKTPLPDLGAIDLTGSPICLVVTPPTGVTTTWVGCTNSDWNTASNWSTGVIPTMSDVVYIPIQAANQLIIDETASCAKMVVQIGAKCLIDYNAGGELVIKF